MDAKSFYNTMRALGEPTVPDGADKATLFGSYERVLSKYDGDVLQRAANNTLDRRTFRNFPLPSECDKACQEARDELNAERGVKASKRENKEDPTWLPQRVKAADRMMNSDIGRKAADEGWIIVLHDFCRVNGRLPEAGGEASTLRLQGLSWKHWYENAKSSAEGKAAPALIAPIARAFAAKAKRLTEAAYGKTAA